MKRIKDTLLDEARQFVDEQQPGFSLVRQLVDRIECDMEQSLKDQIDKAKQHIAETPAYALGVTPLTAEIRAALVARVNWTNAYAATRFGRLLGDCIDEIERQQKGLQQASNATPDDELTDRLIEAAQHVCIACDGELSTLPAYIHDMRMVLGELALRAGDKAKRMSEQDSRTSKDMLSILRGAVVYATENNQLQPSLTIGDIRDAADQIERLQRDLSDLRVAYDCATETNIAQSARLRAASAVLLVCTRCLAEVCLPNAGRFVQITPADGWDFNPARGWRCHKCTGPTKYGDAP